MKSLFSKGGCLFAADFSREIDYIYFTNTILKSSPTETWQSLVCGMNSLWFSDRLESSKDFQMIWFMLVGLDTSGIRQEGFCSVYD